MNLSEKLKSEFGNMDIYLFDQLLKGNFDGRKIILDAGCGSGRNLFFLLNNQFEIYAVDSSPKVISKLINDLKVQGKPINSKNFIAAPLDSIPYPDKKFEYIICNAVLHFAKNENHFRDMVYEMWRVLNSGGILFIRLATMIGIESLVKNIKERIYILPDGTKRFLADEDLISSIINKLNAQLLDPVKTTVVQNQRSMTTLVLKKNI